METPWLSQKVNVSGFKMSVLLVISLLPLFPVSSQVTLSTHSEGRHLKGFHPLLHHSTDVLFARHSSGCWGDCSAGGGGRITVKIFALRVYAMLKRDNNNKVQDKVSVKKKHKPQ